MKLDGSHMEKSMKLGDPFVGFICVGSFWLRRHRFWSFISCSILLPFVSDCWLLHKVLWLLKSPRRMKGLVCCLVRFFSSISLICSCEGMYTEQIVIVLCSVTCVATAWSFDFIGNWLCGMSFLTRIDVPPLARCPVLWM